MVICGRPSIRAAYAGGMFDRGPGWAIWPEHAVLARARTLAQGTHLE